MTNQEQAVSALQEWAAQRSRLDGMRGPLVAQAWNAGARSVAALARAAGVTRDTIYADLRAASIDYYNRDPEMDRLVKAVVALSMAFNPGTRLSARTVARYAAPVAQAAGLLASFTAPELVAAAQAILGALPPATVADTLILRPLLSELDAALAEYTATRRTEAAPLTRFVRARSAGRS